MINSKILTLCLSFLVLSCYQKSPVIKVIDNEQFSAFYNDREIELFSISNKAGIVVQLTNYGARIVSIWVPDKEGNFADVCVGLPTAEDYLNAKAPFFGATIGRYANRIANARFSLHDSTYTLEKNNGENNIHSGKDGFHAKVWDLVSKSESKIVLSLVSPDGEGGFPGNLEVQVSFELNADNELRIEYFAETDKSCPVSFTNHTFFNLLGVGEGTILNHELHINAEYYTPLNALQIPTGELTKVDSTPFDFQTPRAIGERINKSFPQLELCRGYDHNWVLNKPQGNLSLAASLYEPVSGRVMEVLTDEPGLQFYTANFLKGADLDKEGIPIGFRESLCLETQHYPNSPNQHNFPSTILNPGEKYTSTCIYRFSVR